MVGSAHRSRHVAMAVALCVVVPYLACEGLLVVLAGGSATTSLAHRAYSAVTRGPTPPFDPHNAYTWMIADRREIDRRLGALRSAGVGMGNSPYGGLVNDAVAINTEVDGCLVQKPGVRKQMAYLRSNLFNPFDQITYFHDAGAALDPDLAAFFGRYGARTVTLTTNGAGERVTVPVVDTHDVVLVAGDSIANGAMLGDDETLASALQRADHARRYVNLGVSRAKASDIVCALDRAAERYAGRIAAVVYVFCENDFDPARRYGGPAQLLARLTEYRDRVGAPEMVLLYVPYIYNAAPEITRVRGHSHARFSPFLDEKRRLLRLAREADFTVVDFLAAADAARLADGTLFAPLRLYVDHSHLSRVGTERAAAMIRAAVERRRLGPRDAERNGSRP